MKRRDETWFSNEELEVELPRMAEDYHPPGGETLSVAELVHRHLWWFAAALIRGTKEKSLIEMLFNAGITRNGDRISRGSLSRAFNRYDLNKENAAERLKQELALRPRPESRTLQPERSSLETSPAPTIPSSPRTSNKIAKVPAKPAGRPVKAPTEKNAVRAFMDRAARLRRIDGD